MGCFGRGGLRFERMSGADTRPGCLLGMKGVVGRGVDVAGPVGFVWLVCASVGFGECGQIGWGTRPGCLLGMRGVVGRGVGADVAGRWFRPHP